MNDTNEYPSFYAWQEFRARFGMKEVRLDMGALGHQCRKPTTLGTNIPHLCSFEGLSDSRDHGQSIDPNASIEARVQQSRGWAAWPERFKEEIVKGSGPTGRYRLPGRQPKCGQDDSGTMAESCFARPRTFFKGVYYVLEGCRPQRCHDFECRHLWTLSPGGRLSKKKQNTSWGVYAIPRSWRSHLNNLGMQRCCQKQNLRRFQVMKAIRRCWKSGRGWRSNQRMWP